ncbi:hypothetical protein C8J57DRAFT_1101212 [Mycena rebaudengoi]|nr:hypothetical protein C8J57DRAFT_1101212 [Mycena rebaudengoi]
MASQPPPPPLPNPEAPTPAPFSSSRPFACPAAVNNLLPAAPRRPAPRLAPVPPAAAPTPIPAPKKARKPRAGCKIDNNAFRPHVAAVDRLRSWSSPFSLENNAAFRKELLDDAVNKTYAAIFASYAGPMQSNYAAGLLRFHQFCDLHQIPERACMPASHFLLATFISHHIGAIGGGTVKSWMSGIKAWHDINGAKWDGDDRWVELARRTANKEGTAFKHDQRGPVSIEHMIALRSSLDPMSPFDAAVWALATAAFWGCRRLGELTVPTAQGFDPKLHIAKSATARRLRTPEGMPAATLHLLWTKSTREHGGTLTLTGRDDMLCPVKAYDTHMRVDRHVPGDAPLFAFLSADSTWSSMTKDLFMRRCKPIWDTAGLLRVFGHSFRIGSSTELLLAGVQCKVVAALGGWTSLAFLLYWRQIEHIVPMNVGKAYNKKKLDEVAKAFEAFRIANNITIVTLDDF